ncbi:hypothetical protein EIN_228650, partial [Entamoeba invadens IP1]
ILEGVTLNLTTEGQPISKQQPGDKMEEENKKENKEEEGSDEEKEDTPEKMEEEDTPKEVEEKENSTDKKEKDDTESDEEDDMFIGEIEAKARKMDIEKPIEHVMRKVVVLQYLPQLKRILEIPSLKKTISRATIIGIMSDIISLLPEEICILELPNLINLLANELNSKIYEFRDAARKQILAVVFKFGDLYFSEIVSEINRVCDKGFLKKTLPFTYGYILEHIVMNMYGVGSIDDIEKVPFDKMVEIREQKLKIEERINQQIERAKQLEAENEKKEKERVERSGNPSEKDENVQFVTETPQTGMEIEEKVDEPVKQKMEEEGTDDKEYETKEDDEGDVLDKMIQYETSKKGKFKFEQFVIDESVHTITNIVYNFLFNTLEKNKLHVQSKIKLEELAARNDKTLLVFRCIGLLVTNNKVANPLNFCLKKIGKEKQLERIKMYEKIMKAYAKGVVNSRFLTFEQVFTLGFNFAQKSYFEPTIENLLVVPKVKTAGDNKLERIMIDKSKRQSHYMDGGVIDYRMNNHIILEFSLRLCADMLYLVVLTPEKYTEIYEFVVKCLKLPHEETITLSLRMLRFCFRAENKTELGFDISLQVLKRVKERDTVLYNEVLTFMTSLIVHAVDGFTSNLLVAVLDLIRKNNTNMERCASNVLFMLELVKKKVVYSSIVDFMYTYATLMIQHGYGDIVPLIQELLITFITTYPLEKTQYTNFINFFVKNLSFEDKNGRLAICKVLKTLTGSNMDSRAELVKIIYVPTLLRYSVETFDRVRFELTRVLANYLATAGKDNIENVLGVNLCWTNNVKASIRRIGWIGFYVCIRKTPAEFIDDKIAPKIIKTFAKETMEVKEVMLKVWRETKKYNENVIRLALTGEVDGAHDILTSAQGEFPDFGLVIEKAIDNLMEGKRIIEWTRVIHGIVDSNNAMTVEVMKKIGKRQHENLLRLMLALADVDKSSEDYMTLILVYIVKSLNAYKKEICVAARETLELIKGMVKPKIYISSYEKATKYD